MTTDALLGVALESQDEAEFGTLFTGCGMCREELEMLQRRGRDVGVRLAVLDPQPHETVDAVQALTHFRTRVRLERTSRSRTVKERIEMMKQMLLTGRWRPAVVGLMALVLLVGLFSFAPARQAAAQFLGIFRVRKFAAIPVDPAQLERLESLDQLADAGIFGEPTFLREPGDPQDVTDVAEAAALAGFNVRVPTALPENATLGKFTVEGGPAMLFELDRGMMEMLLEAAGVTDATLPPFDTIPVEADFPAMVQQTYYIGGRKVSFMQMPSPTVTLPPGVNPATFGEILLQLLGMPADEAQRLAQSIDWTSTLVIPVPTDVARFHEVEVDGVTGLLLEEKNQNRSYRRHLMVLWQRDGIIYSIEGANDSTDLLLIADSLH